MIARHDGGGGRQVATGMQCLHHTLLVHALVVLGLVQYSDHMRVDCTWVDMVLVVPDKQAKFKFKKTCILLFTQTGVQLEFKFTRTDVNQVLLFCAAKSNMYEHIICMRVIDS